MADLDLTETIIRADRAVFSRARRNGHTAPFAPSREAVAASQSGETAASILRIGVLVAAVGVAVQTAFHLVGLTVFDNEAVFLSADQDEGVFAWVSSSLALAGAFSCVVLALAAARPAVYWALGAVLAFLSLDDVLAIHERTGHEHFGIDPELQIGRALWPLLFSPVLVAGAVLIWVVARRAPVSIGAVIRAGLAALAGAVALEAASVGLFPFSWGPGSKPYETEVIFEEGLELAGTALIASGLAALASTNLAKLAGRARAPE